MSLLPLQILGGTQLLGTALQLPKLASAGFANLLQGASTQSPDPGTKSETEAGGIDGLPGSWKSSPAVDSAQLQQRVESLTSEFRAELAQLLQQHGIEFSGGLELELDALGQLRVANDHPEKPQIESLLAQHDSLTQKFRALASQAQLLNTLEEAQQGSGAADNSESDGAEEWPSISFNQGQQPAFRLSITGAQTERQFIR